MQLIICVRAIQHSSVLRGLCVHTALFLKPEGSSSTATVMLLQQDPTWRERGTPPSPFLECLPSSVLGLRDGCSLMTTVALAWPMMSTVAPIRHGPRCSFRVRYLLDDLMRSPRAGSRYWPCRCRRRCGRCLPPRAAGLLPWPPRWSSGGSSCATRPPACACPRPQPGRGAEADDAQLEAAVTPGPYPSSAATRRLSAADSGRIRGRPHLLLLFPVLVYSAHRHVADLVECNLQRRQWQDQMSGTGG